MKPYKLDVYEQGAAHVIDRATGKKMGYVLAGFTGWYAYDSRHPGRELSFGTSNVHGIRFTYYQTRYRADAADRVWKATRGRRKAAA